MASSSGWSLHSVGLGWQFGGYAVRWLVGALVAVGPLVGKWPPCLFLLLGGCGNKEGLGALPASCLSLVARRQRLQGPVLARVSPAMVGKLALNGLLLKRGKAKEKTCKARGIIYTTSLPSRAVGRIN